MSKRGRKKRGAANQQLGVGAPQMMPGMMDYGMPQNLHGAMPGMQPMMQPMQHLQGMQQGGPSQNSMLDMVAQAIGSLGNRKGSSLQAIKKFLNEKYGIDFTNNQEKNKVSKAVKLGVSRGMFIQEKNSYKLANPQAAMDPMLQQRMGYGQQMGHPQHQGHQGQHQQFNMQGQQQFPMGQYGMHPQFMQQHGFYQQPMGHHGGMPGMDQQAVAPVAAPPAPAGKKKKKKKKKDGAPKRRGAGGLSKPMNLSDDLARVCGGHTMGRTDVVKRLWLYIKQHNLQNPSNKKTIMCDENLRRVFQTDTVDMFTMTKLISGHLTKPTEQPQDNMMEQQQQFYDNSAYQEQHDGDAHEEDGEKQQEWHGV